ncbi:MAG: D-alanine--D-alanine ligase [Alphaproteobacteria bacterium]|nr:D-alanine--D-alanine ligase [Alphaproteobacteria bacterium]
MAKRVTVLMGGWSSEREVSLVSGRESAKALRAAGYTVEEYDVTRDIGALVKALSPAPDAVFNALHGRFGEDGTIQGLLDLLAIPYTHSGVLASALAMDKVVTKRVLATAGIRVPEEVVTTRAQAMAGDLMPRPYVAKPIFEGSSVGVEIVFEGDPLPRFADWEEGDGVMVERYIPGRELTVTVMGERPLAVTEIRAHNGFYDFTAKYTEGRASHLIPAPIVPAAYQEALDTARRAHDALGCRGVSRVDFRYDDTAGEPGALYFLEINTQPGMTPLSLVPEQAAHCGIDFPQLVAWMVEHAQWG